MYPNRESCPWPAHPNTFSYVVAVFEEEIQSQNAKKSINNQATDGDVISSENGTINPMNTKNLFTGNVTTSNTDYQLGNTVLTSKDLVGLSGAPDGSRLKISSSNGSITLNASSNFFAKDSIRYIYEDEDGVHLVLYNALQVLKPEYHGSGLGVMALRQQVRTAQALGFKSIRTEAAGDFFDPDFVGYYTWPRMGFNALVPDDLILPPQLADAVDILDLMSTQEGRDWWKRNGHTFDAELDLRTGSKSLKILEQYLRNKWEVSLW